MTSPGFRLRHLAFCGFAKDSAIVEFGSGLNVIYGASETGKSFVVEALDFMLGGGQELRDIGERVGYDRVFLGIETIGGEQFTLERSAEGGSFRRYQGLHKEPPPEGLEFVELADQHNERNETNLSMFLLSLCGLAGKRVRKNNRGETNSLSFRHLARLLIVNENEITAQHSPLSDGNPITETPNYATFKLLLTGVDDSSLVSSKPKTPEDQSRFAQLEMLEKMLGDYGDRLKTLTKDPSDVPDQLQRLDEALLARSGQLRSTESDYRRLAERRRESRKKLEAGRERREEIAGLLQRFTLLERHYLSDIERLKGIEEGGSLFDVLGKAACPLCGALPEHHRAEECGGDPSAVVAAARSEIAKIKILQAELAGTIGELRKEARRFDRRLPQLEEELESVSTEIEEMVAPTLAKLRASYSEIADKKGQVREAASLLETIKDIEERRAQLEKQENDEKSSSVSSGDLPSTVADDFSKTVEAILKEWHFPEAERIHFDQKKRDLVIAGKLRTARGKGLRAITHSAFTVALLEFCRTNTKPHPGFVVLDSPLLAYREPESEEDKELAGTDLAEQFYGYFATRPSDRQIIVVENRDPPVAIQETGQVTMFSKNPTSGRYGFFPRPATSKDSNETAKQNVGILAYGSLIADPGDEIRAVMTGTKEGIETPFPVEFARTSTKRHGAPTLVPVEGHGARVQAQILLLDTTVEDAADRLYRREIDEVGSGKRYKEPADPKANKVLVKRLMNFQGVDTVLYTHIGANIDDLTPANLAQLAIMSAEALDNGRDGISYLINAKNNNIRTPLSEAYEEEIKRQLDAKDLSEALRVAKERRKQS